MFAIVDYDTGNTLNLKKALNYENIENKLTADPDEILSADAVVLPGVGAFKAAMDALEERNLVEVIKQAAAKKIPMLGICLGMQLLFEDSEEYGLNKGLSLIPGHIKAIPESSGLKVPQMGWNQNQLQQPTSDFQLVDQQYTYFVHSYYADCDPKYIVSSVDYGVQVPSIVQNGNVVGMQFHPEKSGQVGLNLLQKFQEMVKQNDFSRN
ncbi:imidazole glycerol phosphate synthase subunit HisH [Companilactobacillus sp.]|jgi:glutamine amidotransferase|uniref:imidazole glycerol phosphate synthase subunit HisH n=1 Tax=Companilactobacillus sp. TaxID=2767905 RepID=UPI0025BC4F19|nr:imidazole glycerol phosphate synthase subunit HisH [Companilactobacillus sp.]MCH4008863.1 imidazole glycerol phosphate synthase subunit HisH [Companilactobacillus sp.]MCH4050958.1 imidazole glycerol phosphate synthase subunit HisH [Companilactobacillus sp.]MCH4076806.1 imidazole glycerol phosphate synthase subunit HisH [Companilactobacillus sp.]MCH4125381.1 imidazole glycerol phosphate synthase subunit HisH [Companilactobacillus sp.]MCH4131923.1 imidazole glycerol phosphate synthase subunit